MYSKIKFFLDPHEYVRFLFVLITCLIISVAQIVQALSMSRIIDSISDGFDHVFFYFTLILGTMIFEILFSAIETFYLRTASVRLGKSLRLKLNDAITRIKYSNLVEIDDGSLITMYTSDIPNIISWYWDLLKLSYIPFKIIGVTIVLFVISWRVSLTLIIVLPLTLLFGGLVSGKIYSLSKDVRESTSKVNEHFNYVIKFLAIIKTYQLSNLFKKSSDGLLDELCRTQVRVEHRMFIVRFINAINDLLPFIILFSIGAIFVVIGDISVGSIITFSFLIGYLSEGIGYVSGYISQSREVRASIESINSFTNQNFNITENQNTAKTSLTQNPNQYAIVVKDLIFSYEPERNILDNISFAVKNHSKIAIIGASGTGKTTLFRLLTGLYQAQTECIYFSENNIFSAISPEIFKKITVVPQESFMLPIAVKENLCIANQNATNEVIWSSINTAAANYFLQTKNDLDSKVEDLAYRYSNGQVQRMSIARALIKTNEIIFLDEPTSAQDIGTHFKIIKNILSLKNSTVIAITHREDILHEFDAVLWLEKGKIKIFKKFEKGENYVVD